MEWELHNTRNVKLKKIQLRKIVVLLALGATPSVYANELSMTPFGVANAVAITITFTNSTGVTDMGFRSAPDMSCGNEINASYQGGASFPLGTPPTKVAYFNGFLLNIANDLELCLSTTGGTISLDGVVTEDVLHNTHQCSSYTGCYSYTCNYINGNITSITSLVAFTATCY